MSRKPKPKKRMVPRWKAEPFLDRIQICKSMLTIHSFLTFAESEKVQKRIFAARAKATTESP